MELHGFEGVFLVNSHSFNLVYALSKFSKENYSLLIPNPPQTLIGL